MTDIRITFHNEKCIVEAYIIKVKIKFTKVKFRDNKMSDETLSDGHAEKFPVFVHSQFMRSVERWYHDISMISDSKE